MVQKRLPVFSIAWMATIGVFASMGKVARFLWPSWLAIVIIVGIAGTTRDLAMEPPLRTLLTAALVFLLFLAYGLGFHLWLHRMLVPASDRKSFPIRFLGYFGLLILLLSAPIGLALAVIPDASPQPPFDQPAIATFRFIAVVVSAMLPALYLASRWVFVLPASAAGERFGLADAWRLSMGNGLRLLAIFLLVSYGGMLGLAAVVSTVGPFFKDHELTPFVPALTAILIFQIIGLVHMSACGQAYRQLSRA